VPQNCSIHQEQVKLESLYANTEHSGKGIRNEMTGSKRYESRKLQTQLTRACMAASHEPMDVSSDLLTYVRS
jgi:hypothetical protein